MASKSDTATAAKIACKLLDLAFPGRVTVPSHVQYQSAKCQPWCRNCWLPAACFIRPQNSKDVAEVIKIVKGADAKFAIRSGGHNFNPGFSSIDTGVLIDLRDLNTLEIDEDGILQAGAGNTWGDIYAFLEKKGLSAIGGRQSDVGISGYLLGGGMPAFPNLYGLAIDSVKNFEVVLADSTVINANIHENTDLHRALKGGGSNFGIVTRFDIQTYPAIYLQYNVLMYHPSGFEEVLHATVEAQEAMETDPKLGMFASVNPTFIVIGIYYADLEAEQPKVIENFLNLKSLMQAPVPTTKGTIKSLVETIGILGPSTRRLTATATTKVSYDFYVQVHNLWLDSARKYTKISNLWYNIQPTSTTAVQIGEEQGGNSLGLQKVPQTWWSLVAEWSEESDDAAVAHDLEEFTEDVSRLAKDQGLYLDFKFMNDAEFSQKVLSSYGLENMKRLQEASAKYDPEQLFQRLQNSGFLLRNP
ncbi:6-hydroxy-D-nicotine oxidase [Daldinia grandis]|nr:6-hydroxy-D-nicotine oxidase [Daldinia grandis]